MATRNIVPRATGEGNIGTNLKHWLKGWFDSIFCAGDITDGSDSITVAELARLPDPESGDDGKVLTYDYGTDAYVLETNVAVDERVKASADDPSAGYLDAKIDGINLDIISEKIAVKVGSDLEEAITLRHASGSDNQDALEVETEDSGINVQEALNTLESDQHTHSNKTILDQIQEALTTILKAGYDGVVSAFSSHKDAIYGIHGIESGDEIAGISDIAIDANLSSEAQDAISKRHTQNTDTVLVGESGIDLIDTGILKDNLLVDALITIDGRDLSVDGAKLDGIESGAVALATVKADADIASAISLKHTQNTDSKIIASDTSIEILGESGDGYISFKEDNEEIMRISDKSIDWLSGNVIYVPIDGDILTYINNAEEGDTLILASGIYNITKNISVTKSINILGQGKLNLDDVKKITAFVDAGGGITNITCSTHEFMSSGTATITIIGTTNYDGIYSATYIGANSFSIVKQYISDDATGIAMKGTFSGTLINCTIGNKNIFSVSVSNVKLSNFSIYFDNITSGTSNGIAMGDGATNLIAENITILGTGTYATNGIYIYDGNATLRNIDILLTTAQNAVGIFARNVASLTVTINCYNVKSTIISAGTAYTVYGFRALNTDNPNTVTLNLYNCQGFVSKNGGTSIAYALQVTSATTNNAVVNAYNSVFSAIGATTKYDVIQTGTNICNLYNCTLVNGTISGTVTFLGMIVTKNLYVSDKLGIGTVSPEALLEIQGAEGLDAVLCLDADDGDNNEDTWFIKSLASDNSLSIINHTTERLKLTYDGILNTQDIYPLIDNTYFLGRNDLGSPKAWKGVVVKDTTNGNYYAIQVTNGSVVATLMESGGI